ncbi:uncharacterized protein MCYG_06510 [Microsporum canis CBS 113480]|uniref:Uncharacterized protein n=1 Tax=Arthroderma otae (strain ATCC MYA-4605 / CBS 113480) TaxID=554155 RepID=C5FUV7_ARTOC|nr:uncharacterized protein MCYG_06510 [Microsporum canis CBS 113480]EEQ33691.1 predicted protein [Microsporum canis CBS 113480]
MSVPVTVFDGLAGPMYKGGKPSMYIHALGIFWCLDTRASVVSEDASDVPNQERPINFLAYPTPSKRQVLTLIAGRSPYSAPLSPPQLLLMAWALEKQFP